MNTIHRLGALLLSAISTLPLAAPRARAAAGDLDTFNANVEPGVANIWDTAVRPDGKIMIAGDFGYVGNWLSEAYNFAQLNTDGTLDWGYGVPGHPFAPVHCRNVAVQADGKLLVSIIWTSSTHYLRFLPDGQLDPSFLFDETGLGGVFGIGANADVWCFATQTDGRILLGGGFTLISEIARNRIARLQANGLVDQTFNPNANGTVNCLALQPDGKILIGGDFTAVGGIARNRLARLNADGTLDPGFDPNVNQFVATVALQPDGRILIGGAFTTVGGVARNRFARLETTGALDMGFDPNANGIVRCIALQADGRILPGGAFTAMGGTTRNRIARVNANGTLDPGFDPNVTGVGVHTLSLQPDGKVVLGGRFTALQPNGAAAATPRNAVARLLNDPATQTLSAPDTAHITWVRGGTVPEVSRVTFEVSTDGGATWGAPITPVRGGVLSNWRVDGGIALPASGLLRARGVTTSGYNNGGSGIIEQVITFSGLVNAPEITVTGNGAVIPDGDTTPGLPDGTEFHAAFGASTAVRTFTITSTGTAALNLTGTPKVVVSGPHAADFTVTLQPASPLAATNGATTFQVTFTPGAVGARNATLTFANDDANEASFDFAVTGRGLSFTTDTDGDGMNDASEVMGAALGFNWQVSQPALVQTYNGMANGAGLYTTAQVQALHMDMPLLQRNPGTNTFTFTFGLRKSTTLAPGSFVPFPFTPAGTSVNGAGKVQYQFTSPDNAAFFRLEMP